MPIRRVKAVADVRMKDTESGFTLIEIVIAISILAIIMMVTYSSLDQIIRTKYALDDSREMKAVVNSVLVRMTRELQLAKSGLPLLPQRDKIGQFNKPNLNLLGENLKLPNREEGDSITFIASQGGQYLPDGLTHSGDVQITYRVEEDPEQEGQQNRTYYLVREEVPYLRSAEEAYKDSMIFPMTRKLVGLKFRYYDSRTNKWVSSWGQNANLRVPQIIEFEVKLRSEKGSIGTFKTAVALRSVNDG